MKFVKGAILSLAIFIMLQLVNIQAEAFGIGSDGFVYYNKVNATYPAMNRNTYNSSSFWSSFVGSDNNSVYNIAPAFAKQSNSRGASSMPDHLNFGTTFKHKNDDNTYWVYYKYYFEDAIKPSANKGDLSVAFAANLTNDKHWNVERHLDNWTAYPTTYVSASNKTLIKHDTGSKHYDTTVTLGRNSFQPIGAWPWNNELRFVAYGNTCTCGSSKVSNISILLADLAGPKVESITTSRLLPDGITMEPYNRFKGKDTMYIHLNFNENIRFSNDTAMKLEDAPKLKLKLKRISDNIQETGVSAEAELVSLDGKTLIFRYVIPETYLLGGMEEKVNHYIYEIEPFANQTSWVSSSESFDLKLMGKSGAHLNSAQKSTSMIVDLAGNPIELSSTTVLESPAYMDFVMPYVKKIEIARANQADPTQMSRSDVFTKVGEKLGFFVYFSEEMYFVRASDKACLEPEYYIRYDNERNRIGVYMEEPYFDDVQISVMADLNVGIAETPVTAKAKYMTSVSDGVNGPILSKVYFEMEGTSISSAMEPIIFNGEQLPIGINKIYMVKGSETYALSDTRGNIYDYNKEIVNVVDGERVMPLNELWLDVVNPTSTTTLTSGSSGYAPLGYTGGSLSEFCFPIKAEDRADHGAGYMSLTNGETGSFMWRDNATGTSTDYPFEYAVTGDVVKPLNTAYKLGTTGEKFTFTQLDGGNYIHIRLLDDVEYNIGDSDIVIYPVDNAGNEGEVPFKLDYVMDRAGPVSLRGKFTQQYHAPSSAGRIDTEISLWDFNDIAGIQYQWTITGEAPVEEQWIPISYTTEDDDPYIRADITLSAENLTPGSIHCKTLNVKGIDSLGHTNMESFDFTYDMTLPKFNMEFVTNPSEPLAQHSLKIHMPQTHVSSPAVANYVMVEVKKKLSYGGYAGRRLYRCSFDSLFYSAGNTILKGPDNAWDLLAVGSNPKAEGWVAATPIHVTDPTNVEYIAYGGPFTDYPFYYNIWDDEIILLDKLFNKTYGQVEITVMSRRLSGNGQEGYIKDTELYSRETFIYNYANASAIGPNEIIHNAVITPQTAVHYGTYYKQAEKPYSAVPTSPLLLQSLDGVAFNVTLSNKLVPVYGLQDISFDSADTYFALYKTDEGKPDELVFTTSLIPKDSQEVVIPSGVATAHGTYKAVVSVKCKNSDHIDKHEYTKIMVDGRKTETLGVTEVRTKRTIGNVELPEVRTGYDIGYDSRTSEILLSAEQNIIQSILFESDLPSLTFGTNTDHCAYIKVWNENNSIYIPQERYKWIPFNGKRSYDTMLFNASSINPINSRLSSSDPTVFAVIPIVEGMNEIKYQIATTSGYTTPVQTLWVKAGNAAPEIKMALSPEKKAGVTINGDIVASINDLSSSVVSPETLQIGVVPPAGVVFDEDAIKNFIKYRQITLPRNGDYYFYTVDKYHNYGYQKVTVDYIDKEGPALAVTNLSNAVNNTYDFEAVITDAMNIEGCKLYFSFDDTYSALLGVDSGTAFEVPMTQWKATKKSQTGLVCVSAPSGSGSTRRISFSGAFKYDSADPAPTAVRTITLYAEDGAGNKSDSYSVDLTVRNEPASYLSGTLEAGGFKASFSKPVILSMPSESTIAPSYEMVKGNLRFYSNGVYPIKFNDIFGNSVETNVVVNHYDALYSCTVNISETAPTNQNVEVAINAAFNNKITLEMPANIPGAVIQKEYNAKGDVIGASVSMTQNGTFTFVLKPVDGAFPTQTRTITASNIDKTAPAVGLSWVYTSEVVNGITKGEIIASLDSNEELFSLDGTGTTHVFTLTDQQPYTFNYRDISGNTGSITATPSAEIVPKESVLDDVTPPDYALSVYQNKDGFSITKVAGYDKEEYEMIVDKASAFPLFSGILRLQFDITDQNQTTLSIKEGSVPGVSVKGTAVSVTQNAQFTVQMIDANNNLTEVPVIIDKADHTAPVGDITFVKTGPYAIRGYLTLSDDMPGRITLLNATGVLLETTPGENFGKYYHDFLDNESFTFVFKDAAGNGGSKTAVVDTLDMTEPTGSILLWNPYFIDASGIEHKGQLSDKVTNSDVSVYLQFSKPIRTITPSIMDGIGSLGDIAIQQTEDNAIIVFKQNAKIKLAFTALNGKSASTVLVVDIIDKTAPVIVSALSSASPNAMTYTFISNEPVVFEDGEKASEPDISFNKTFELNGQYPLKFTDEAGNTKTVLVTIAGIDRLAPGLSIVDLPATKESVASYNDANGTSIEHWMTNTSINIKVSMDEDGTLSFNGITYSANAGQQVTLNIAYNGSYEIVAADNAGMVTRYPFRIDCIDKTKPQILLPGGSLNVKQGTALGNFETMALEEVSVSDNADINPAIALSAGLTHEQLNMPGTYSIEYTATDRAGNSRIATYFVRVYDQNALEVLVNGELVQVGETLFIGDSNQMNVTVNNLPSGTGGYEPYKMYWKAGLNTAGQMKNASAFTGSFTASKNGFYTIYIVTQSKVGFITYIYVQQ